MIDQALQKLIEFIEQASPVLWGILIKQVYSDIVTYFLWSIFTLAIAFGFYKLGKYHGKLHKEIGWQDDEHELLSLFSYAGSSIALIAFPFLLTTCIRIIVNPYYYAITNILNGLTGK